MDKKNPDPLQIPISPEDIQRMNAHSEHLREIGEQSDLEDSYLIVSFTNSATMDPKFVRDFNNSQRGFIVMMAEERGVSPREMALLLRTSLAQPKSTRH